MTIETALTFLLASGLLALAPGPDNLFVLSQAMLYGRWAGIYITLGLCTGLLVHTSAVVLGVVTLFQRSGMLLALKAVGALYLLYIAWKTFRAKPMPLGHSSSAMTAGALYRRGIVMNVTNPKVAIFFLAFLPQFVQAERGSMALQLIQLGGLFMLTALLVFSGIAFLAGTLGEKIKSNQSLQRWLNYLVATVLVALAARLLVWD